MAQEIPPTSDEPNDIESLLRTLSPAKCEIPQATVMYRCGYEAGRQSIVTKPGHHSSRKRWTDLLLSACVVAMMVGPVSYWAGANRAPQGNAIGTAIAEETKSRQQPEDTLLAQSSTTPQQPPESPSSNNKSLADNATEASPTMSDWGQQIAQLKLQTPNASNRSPFSSTASSYYLTSRTQLLTTNPEQELSRLDRIHNKQKFEIVEAAIEGPQRKPLTPKTPFQRDSQDDHINTQLWEDLIQ